MNKKKLTLGEALIAVDILSRDQLNEALRLQEKTREKIGRILLNLGYVTPEQLAYALAHQQGFEFVKLSDMSISPKVIKLVTYDLCKKYALIPIEMENDVLKIAIADPLNLIALDDLRVCLEKEIQGVIAEEGDIQAAIKKYYSQAEKSAQPYLGKKTDIQLESNVDVINALKAEGEEVGDEEAPVIQLVSRIIVEAFKRRASDIHVEPMKDEVRIRYRIDGVLREAPGPSKALQGSVISRLKIMAKLDIAEKRLPQDGRIKLQIQNRDVDVRVSTLPALYGESIVLRLLDREQLLLTMEAIGFSEDDEKTFTNLINVPNGIILVTGPTGSGKTTTLYASLHAINKPNRKIITVEDPVEYQLSGINQVHVKPAIGLTFSSGLRSILRQAPNVIMIGEIRDLETANIAIEASLTGHLVFSTLHTNDAASTITRLIDMGVKAYLVASAVQAILAQRLVKKICSYCKEPVKPKSDLLELLGISAEKAKHATFYQGRGCKECSQTGYLGRIAIFELLVLNDEICELIYKKVSSNIIRERARQCGMRTLREDAVAKVFQGLTTVVEVIRVTQSDID
ncbi:MAG: Flp pilus assembly complex ATPase component TadA [Candidatus Omnitrophica bacterium]|nr:Flp pilus assembly complex ATPase component TadA [Candidatus Omnitrophota bacterium]